MGCMYSESGATRHDRENLRPRTLCGYPSGDLLGQGGERAAARGDCEFQFHHCIGGGAIVDSATCMSKGREEAPMFFGPCLPPIYWARAQERERERERERESERESES